MPLTGRRRRGRQVARHRRIGDTAADTGGRKRLRARRIRSQLTTYQHLQAMILVQEVRSKDELVARRKLQALEFVVGRQVDALIPRVGSQRRRIVGITRLRVGVHINLTTVVELRLLVFLTQELIFQRELRRNGISRPFSPCQIRDGHGVTVGNHVTQVVRRTTAVVGHQAGCGGSGRHYIIFSRVVIFTYAIGRLAILLAVNGHVRHGLICLVQEIVVVVLVVLRISQTEVGGELDAVGHIVVQGQTS